jgi:beta-lactam-binding protein with PASTA domain
MHVHTHAPLIIALLAASALFLTACAGDSAGSQRVVGSATASTSSGTADTGPSAPTIMPDLVGMMLEEASADLVAVNVRVVQRARIAPEAAGTVLEQNPVSGSQGRRSRRW